jgi:hypothetical protein
VRLAAVVHLVLEQVRDDVAAPLALDPAAATVEIDDLVERRRRQRIDVVDESAGRRAPAPSASTPSATPCGASRQTCSIAASPSSAAM